MAELQEWTVEEPWLESGCGLGEGPYFEKESNSIRFVDIKKKRIHSASLTDGPSSLSTLELDVPPSVTCNIAGIDPRERILVGVKSGIAVLDRKTGSYEVLSRFGEPPNDRLRGNDGACDPHGRFWLGAMTDFGYGGCFPEGLFTLRII